MRAGDEQMLDRIFFVRLGTLQPFAAPALRVVDARRGSFDVALMTDRNDHRFFGDQILQVDVAEFFVGNLGATGVTKAAFDLFQIFFDDADRCVVDCPRISR